MRGGVAPLHYKLEEAEAPRLKKEVAEVEAEAPRLKKEVVEEEAEAPRLKKEVAEEEAVAPSMRLERPATLPLEAVESLGLKGSATVTFCNCAFVLLVRD